MVSSRLHLPFVVSFLFIPISVLGHAEGNLSCYDCKFEKDSSSDEKLQCIYNVSSLYAPRQCQPHEDKCMVHRVRLNRVLHSYERNCAESCVQYCSTRGLGVDHETCSYCCDTDGCNHFVNLATPSVAWRPLVLMTSAMTACILIWETGTVFEMKA